MDVSIIFCCRGMLTVLNDLTEVNTIGDGFRQEQPRSRAALAGTVAARLSFRQGPPTISREGAAHGRRNMDDATRDRVDLMASAFATPPVGWR